MTGRNHEQVWKSALIECEPGFEDRVGDLAFEAGFSGLKEDSVSGRTQFTAYYAVVPGDDPLERLAPLIAVETPDSRAIARIISVDVIPDTDWETNWRVGLGAIEAGKRLVVRPSWVEYENRDNRIEIVIDPKMAFGTGGHATTFLCLEAIEKLDPAGKTVLDAGCGSGVLSIAAVKLGASRVFGFDNDPPSIENARENAELNGVADRAVFSDADLSTVDAVPADIVLANLISGVLVRYLDRFREFLAPGGTIVFSGLLAEEEDMFLGHLLKKGFSVIEAGHRDEWIAILARIP